MPTEKPTFKLKTLTLQTLDSCLLHLCAIVRVQIEDIEHFIAKAKSNFAKTRIVGPSFVDHCKSNTNLQLQYQ